MTKLSIALITVLCLNELYLFRCTTTETVITVDKALRQKLQFKINITFPALPCKEVHLDAMDVAGDNQLDISDHFMKQRITNDGKPILGSFKETLNSIEAEPDDPTLDPSYCGDCYGAGETSTSCCNTCDSVLNAYSKKGWSTRTLLQTCPQCIREKKGLHAITKGEGCNLSGTMEVNKVSGNFHVAMGESTVRDGRHVHMFLPEDAPNFNCSHIIHELTLNNPSGSLNGYARYVDKSTGLYQYFLKIMPRKDGYVYSHTERFRPLMVEVEDTIPGMVGVGGTKSKTHEHHMVQTSLLPGVFFIYEIEPFRVEEIEVSPSFGHFIIRIVGIVGGVIAVVGAIEGGFGSGERNNFF
ncbi:hypothetical protein TrVE_jg7628 [Triparma verrucosa]|uniref:Endoplasmic reticulum-Golgi intermediate compartment protein 3 n=1 Tax=Triparma verrucosa TaxID=1606542 RepID=A0A9W7F2X0_9STRA|nr:hypothetical protein TrVE_jg7628 [Triparma verrucosa]